MNSDGVETLRARCADLEARNAALEAQVASHAQLIQRLERDTERLTGFHRAHLARLAESDDNELRKRHADVSAQNAILWHEMLEKERRAAFADVYGHYTSCEPMDACDRLLLDMSKSRIADMRQRHHENMGRVRQSAQQRLEKLERDIKHLRRSHQDDLVHWVRDRARLAKIQTHIYEMNLCVSDFCKDDLADRTLEIDQAKMLKSNLAAIRELTTNSNEQIVRGYSSCPAAYDLVQLYDEDTVRHADSLHSIAGFCGTICAKFEQYAAAKNLTADQRLAALATLLHDQDIESDAVVVYHLVTTRMLPRYMSYRSLEDISACLSDAVRTLPSHTAGMARHEAEVHGELAYAKHEIDLLKHVNKQKDRAAPHTNARGEAGKPA